MYTYIYTYIYIFIYIYIYIYTYIFIVRERERKRERQRKDRKIGRIARNQLGGGRFIKCCVAATKSRAWVDFPRLPAPWGLVDTSYLVAFHYIQYADELLYVTWRNRFGSIRFGSGLFEKSSVRFPSVRTIKFPGSACVCRSRRGSVRFGSVRFRSRFRPVPELNGSVRFGLAGSVWFLIPSVYNF